MFLSFWLLSLDTILFLITLAWNIFFLIIFCLLSGKVTRMWIVLPRTSTTDHLRKTKLYTKQHLNALLFICDTFFDWKTNEYFLKYVFVLKNEIFYKHITEIHMLRLNKLILSFFSTIKPCSIRFSITSSSKVQEIWEKINRTKVFVDHIFW